MSIRSLTITLYAYIIDLIFPRGHVSLIIFALFGTYPIRGDSWNPKRLPPVQTDKIVTWDGHIFFHIFFAVSMQ